MNPSRFNLGLTNPNSKGYIFPKGNKIGDLKSSASGSLTRKYIFCKNSGAENITECTLNPNCCNNVNTNVNLPLYENTVLFGSYLDNNNYSQAFFTEFNNDGKWTPGKRVTVPNDANTDPGTNILGVSLSSVGNGVAAGFYTNINDKHEALLLSQQNGDSWNTNNVTLESLPHFVPYNNGGFSQISAISASSNGNAIAGGFYYSSLPKGKVAFIINQESGTWKKPITFMDISNSYSSIHCVSTSLDGYGHAGGSYTNNQGIYEAFVVNKTNGIWDTNVTTLTLPPGALNTANSSVTCVSSTNDSFIVGGYYRDSSGTQPFVALGKNNLIHNAFNTSPENFNPANNPISKITCVSISPDGSTIVAGGYQSFHYSIGLQTPTFNLSFLLNIREDNSFNLTIVNLPPDTSNGLVPYSNNPSTVITSVTAYNGGYAKAYGYYTNINNEYQPMVVKKQKNSSSWDSSANNVSGINSIHFSSFHADDNDVFYKTNSSNNIGNINVPDTNKILIANNNYQIATVTLPPDAKNLGQNAFSTAAAYI